MTSGFMRRSARKALQSASDLLFRKPLVLAAVSALCLPSYASAATWYLDQDGDGYGTPLTSVESDTQPLNYVSNDLDCDDSNATVSPDAPDVADGIDNDCSGTADDDPAYWTTFWRDLDEDGYGDPLSPLDAPVQPAGYVSNDEDCDDTDADVSPDSTEIEDGIDNNCDGIIDEGFAAFPSLQLEVTATPNPITTYGEEVTVQIITRNNGNTASGIVDVQINGFLSVDGLQGSTCSFPQPLASGQSYSCTWTASIAPGIYDFVANDGDLTTQLNLVNGDVTGPTVAISGAPTEPNARTPFDIEIAFSEGVSGFTIDDVSVGNGTASNLQVLASDAQTFPQTFGVTITPAPTGSVTLDVGAGVAADGADNPNSAATQVVVRYDRVAPTVAINGAPAQITTTAPFDATIAFSEPVLGFEQGDVSVGNGSVSEFSGSGDSYSIEITPDGNGDVTLNVAAGVAQDEAGNDNTAATQILIPTDTTPPALVINGVPGSFAPGDVFNASFDFGEDVTGFEAGDILLSGASAGALSGGPRVYTMTITPDGNDNVTVSVAEGAAQDAFGNPSSAANASSSIDSAPVASEMIAEFMEARARNLLQNQPRLSRFLSGRGGGRFDAQVTRGQADFSLMTRSDAPLWLDLQGARTDFDGTPDQSTYVLATIGGHFAIAPGVLVGAMVEADYSDFDQGGGAGVSGRGWMAGPYFVAKASGQPLTFEGRLLYGESTNDVSPFGTFTDTFQTRRMLALLAVEGRVETARVTYFPRLEFSHVQDRQLAYVDGLANAVPEQTVRLSELSAGLNFEMPLFGARGIIC